VCMVLTGWAAAHQQSFLFGASSRRLLSGGGQGGGGCGGGVGSYFHKNKKLINNKQIAEDLNQQIFEERSGNPLRHYQKTRAADMLEESAFEEHENL
jgi:hypothetical protein